MLEETMDVSEKLMNSRCRLITLEPWYGTMAAMFQWRHDDSIKTMGVRIVNGGLVECLYNKEFCDELSIEQMMGVLKHEIEHVVRLHCVRGGAGASRDHDLFNIACDMVINGTKSHPNIENLPGRWIGLPDDFQKNMTAEEVYDKLDKEGTSYNGSCGKCGGSGKIKGPPGANGQPGKDQKCPQCDGKGKQQKQLGTGKGNKHQIDGDLIDDHDMWDGSTVSEDEARQVVKDLVHQAGIKAGNAPGHLTDAIKALEDPVVNWKYELRQFVGRQVGSKRPTWSRQNRRRPIFGVKGQSHHASTKLTVMVDTSGSVSQKMLAQFFTEMESMAHRFKITLMQFDHGYQCHNKYHRGDWKKLQVKGRGGTSFIEAFKHLEEKKLVGKINIVCTDGEAPWPEKRDYPTLWCIFRHSNQEFKPPFGTVIYLDGHKGKSAKKGSKGGNSDDADDSEG